MTFRPQMWPTVMMLVGLVVLVSLGNWQLDRREWKLGLIADINARTTQPAIDFAEALSLHQAGDPVEYLPVTLDGEYQHDKEIALFRQSKEGKGGYHIFTPLLTQSGLAVWVDRGYVPPDQKTAQTRAEGQITGSVTIEGLVRTDGTPGSFVPPNNPEKGEWFFRDHRAMAEAVDLQTVAPLFIDSAETNVPGGLPRGGQTRIALKNDHLGYALTWFGLAVVLVGVYLAHQISLGRLSFSANKSK